MIAHLRTARRVLTVATKAAARGDDKLAAQMFMLAARLQIKY